MHEGRQVANIAAGTLGKANPRAVTPSTLFNVFSVSKGVLSIALLRLVQENRVELDDSVSKYWPAFKKDKITVRHVLAHQTGLANAIPEDATLDTLLNWSYMKKHMEVATPEHEPGVKTMYHYLTYAWICGGIIEEVTKRPYDQFLDEILSKINVHLDLFLGGIPKQIDGNKLAVLSMDKVLPKIDQASIPEKISDDSGQLANGDDDTTTRKPQKKILAKYRGLEQLSNPSVFNMRKVREAKLPSANGHASAASLAAVFDAVLSDHGTGKSGLLSKATVDMARTPSVPTGGGQALDDEILLSNRYASFGLGFSTHEFVMSDGNKVRSIGHSGIGGSVVVAIPECQLSVAFVTNHLSFRNSEIRSKLLKIAFEEFGLEVPSSLLM